MTTTLSFHSEATKELYPDIIKVRITIYTMGKVQKDVLSELEDKLTFIREFVTKLSTYQNESYSQTSMKTKTDGTRKRNYTEKITGYRSEVSVHFILNFDKDKSVRDMVDLINMSIDKDIDCGHNFEVSPELAQKTYDELYIQAVNDGVKATQNKISQIDYFKGKQLYLDTITDYSARVATPNEKRWDPTPTIQSSVKMLNDSRLKKRLAILEEAEADMECIDTPMYSFADGLYAPEELVTASTIMWLFNNTFTAKCEVNLQFEVG